MGDFNRPLPHLKEEHLADLRCSGLSPEQAAIAGHFSVDQGRAKELLGYSLPGLVFQYCNIDGKPLLRTDGKPFYRIKPDWGAEKTDDSPKYLSPKKQGCRPYFSSLYSGNWQKTASSTRVDIWETEGEKKGDCGCANSLAVIAFSGVDGWVDRCNRSTGKELPESRALPELDCIDWRNRRVNQCYDSDIIEKTPVQLALAKRAKCLKQLGAHPYLILLPNEVDGSKNGLDDFVVRHGIEALRVLDREAEPTPLKVEIIESNDGKIEQVCLNLKEPESHGKAILAWSVLKEHWAFRPGIGWYKWQETHWNYRADTEFEASLTQFMDAQHWKKRSSSIVTSVVRELRSRLLIPEESWQPFNKLAFTNGTLDVVSNQFTPHHDPGDRITQIRPFAFNPSAECPQWRAFLDDAMAGDYELVNLIQAIFRYAVLPRAKDKKFEIEKSFDFYGAKGTGKGTVLDTLTNLVGIENIGPAGVNTFKDQIGLGQLLDKSLAIDCDASGLLSNVGYYNQVVSNEPVPVKKLYRDSLTTRLGVVVIRGYNTFISVSEGSEGLDRRVIVVPFTNPPTIIDLELAEKLRSELSGIFAWCYSISREVMKSRILLAGKIAAIAKASIDRFEANNPEFNFLSEQFPDGSAAIKAGILYQQYKEWCYKNGYLPISRVAFRPAIERFGCKRKPKTNGCYGYCIPRMSDFDIVAYLGMVQGQGTTQGYLEDSSKSSPERSRDSCRELNVQSKELNNSNSQLKSGDLSQLSTTIPNLALSNFSANPQPSPIVLSIYPWCNKQVGDRVRYIGKQYVKQYRDLELTVSKIQGSQITCRKPDGFFTTWLPSEDLELC